MKKQIIPACIAYSKEVAEGVADKQSLGISADGERELARQITDKTSGLFQHTQALDAAVAGIPAGAAPQARYCADTVLPAMSAARALADELELLVGESHWPFPTYRNLLFYV